VLFGGPVLIKKLVEANLLDIPVLLREQQMTTVHLNLYAHPGCRRNISIYAHASVSARCKETEDIRALDWCPRPVVFPL